MPKTSFEELIASGEYVELNGQYCHADVDWIDWFSADLENVCLACGDHATKMNRRRCKTCVDRKIYTQFRQCAGCNSFIGVRKLGMEYCVYCEKKREGISELIGCVDCPFCGIYRAFQSTFDKYGCCSRCVFPMRHRKKLEEMAAREALLVDQQVDLLAGLQI